jgi:NAD(P)-dependent dehydrogenase (short-subunit alcohol dehydrogenase family)
MFSLDGKVAIVTGAARGLGKAIAQGLVSSGASVVACDRDEAAVRAVALQIGSPDRVQGCLVDITEPTTVDALLDYTAKRFGAPDIWVNNAAIDIVEPFESISLESWRKVLDVDLTGAFIAAQRAARAMIKSRKQGSIINITSVAATAAIAQLSAYSAAKAGLAQLTRVMALELAPHSIRVNAIAPGYLENIMVGAEATHADANTENHIRRFTPLGRRARLAEIVGPVIFLASDAATYITGATMPVDGGYTAV